jgi:hypothetical protein
MMLVVNPCQNGYMTYDGVKLRTSLLQPVFSLHGRVDSQGLGVEPLHTAPFGVEVVQSDILPALEDSRVSDVT